MSSPSSATTRSRTRRQSSYSSSNVPLSPAPREESPYPPDMPRPELTRNRSSISVASMSKEEIKNMEALINGYEAEEEMIMNKLSRRLDELRRHEHAMSVAMEAESESIVNRLQRQLRIVQAQLAAAQAGQAAGNAEGGGPSGTASTPTPNVQLPNAVGLQAFLSGSDPVVMGNAVEALRAEKNEMQKRIDSLSNENDSLRQELIDLRRRLNIPVDDLVGLGSRRRTTPTLPPSQAGTAVPTPEGGSGPSQPISFNRQPTTGTSTSTSSASDAAVSPLVSYSAAETGATSISPSPFGSASYSYTVPPAPANTFAGSPVGYYTAGGRITHPPGTGGMPLTYPSVPPPSLSTSLASTSAVSPAGSPTHSRRPSLGRIAETGSFARGRVESFGVGGGRSLRDRGKDEAVPEEAVED